MKTLIRKIFLHIRIRSKHAFDALRSEHLKKNLLQAIPFWIGSILTGLISVFYTKLFGWSEEVKLLLFQSSTWWFFLVTPVCFITSWWIVSKFAPYARGSGIPQVIAAIELAKPKYNDKIKKLLSIPIIIVKIIS